MECGTVSGEYACLLDEQKYVDFCSKFNHKIEGAKDLTAFKNAKTREWLYQTCGIVFREEIERIRSFMEDPYAGIAALDVPESNIFDKKANSVYGVAITVGIFGNLGKPNIDSLSKMPFSIFSASHENARLLESEKVIHYSPEVKLGFHNDGMFRDNEIHIPFHIMVYNMYINYRRPGNFKWVSIACWDKAGMFWDLLKEKSAKIKITPNFYLDKEGKINSSLVDLVETPICKFNNRGEKMYFLNGKVLQADNQTEIIGLVKAMRDSISDNPMKISIAQKERRAFYLRNDYGFHARDIFEEPIEDADLTRVFIRAVDLNAKMYSLY